MDVFTCLGYTPRVKLSSHMVSLSLIFCLFKVLFIYFEREREREYESQAGSMILAEPDMGLNLMTMRS